MVPSFVQAIGQPKKHEGVRIVVQSKQVRKRPPQLKPVRMKHAANAGSAPWVGARAAFWRIYS